MKRFICTALLLAMLAFESTELYATTLLQIGEHQWIINDGRPMPVAAVAPMAPVNPISDLPIRSLRFEASSECIRPDVAQWAPIDAERATSISGHVGQANEAGRFVVVSRTLVDLIQLRYLRIPCAGALRYAHWVDRPRTLALVVEDVDEVWMDSSGRSLGYLFAGTESLFVIDLARGEMKRLMTSKGRLRAAHIGADGATAMAVQETTIGSGIMGLIRSLAGHPVNRSAYRLLVLSDGASHEYLLIQSNGGLGVSFGHAAQTPDAIASEMTRPSANARRE